jgi:GAF domain-containing protein
MCSKQFSHEGFDEPSYSQYEVDNLAQVATDFGVQLGSVADPDGSDSISRVYQYDFEPVSSPLSEGELAHDYLNPDAMELTDILPSIQLLAGISEVFNRIVRGVVEGLGYTGAMLTVLDNENLTLSVQALALNSLTHQTHHRHWNMVEKVVGVQIIGNSVSLEHDSANLGVQSCLTGEIRITHDLYDLFQPAVDPKLSYRVQRATDIKTCISIPLLVGNNVVGSLYAGTTKSNISQADISALNYFVANAAIAVQNSILFEQLNQKLARRESELRQLQSIERTINSSLDLQEVLKRILNGALDLTRAEYGQVVLTGKYASDLVSQVSFPEVLDSIYDIKSGVTQAITQDRQPKLIQNPALTAQSPDPEQQPSAGYGSYSTVMQSLLGVPILLEGELIGVINIASQEAEAFNEQSLDLLEQLAVQAAIAINNAYQFKAEQEIRERLSNAAQVLAMGDLASNMVHSINNEVGSIRADLKYLKQRQARGKLKIFELTELLDEMLGNAEAILAKAENIRKPFQQLPQEAIDVNECITNVLAEKQKDLANAIIIEELSEVPPVMATRQLELVFENLIKNALAAMSGQDRGVLRVCTGSSIEGNWVEATIQDSGPGLAQGLNPDDIFNLGVSGQKDRWGYGLWWCKAFLSRWGGQIQLIKNNKKGCKFLVRLPAAPEPERTVKDAT